jgi:Ni/Co efflux regulator RcnB
MRKTLLFLLVASAAAPAFAADNDANNDGDRAARREARAERAEARSERQAERAQQAPSSEPQAQVRTLEPTQVDRPVVREQRQQLVHERVLEHRSQRGAGDASGPPALEQRMVRSERSLGTEPPRPTMEPRRQVTDSVREWRGRERRVGNSPAEIEPHNGNLGGSFRELRREPTGRDAIGNRRGPVIGSIPRPGTQPPLPTSTRQSRTNRLSSLTAQHWRNNWRSDHRYDWRSHRRHHRSLFRFGIYYDPFGWNYRHYSIGSRLWPSYYRSSFWLSDPWQYRLPYAPPGYRWIRYYDDALLVDTWDGQVVDVIYNFFW